MADHIQDAATSVHHLVPRSRCAELGLNPQDPRNLKRVNHEQHLALHRMFGNRHGYEIMNILIALMEKNDKQLKNTLDYWIVFKHMSYEQAISHILAHWTPPYDYYSPKKLPPL